MPDFKMHNAYAPLDSLAVLLRGGRGKGRRRKRIGE